MDVKTLNVGKAGVTEEFLREAQAQLNKHKKIRIRFLKSARTKSDRKSIADEIVSQLSGARLSDVRGNTIVVSTLI